MKINSFVKKNKKMIFLIGENGLAFPVSENLTGTKGIICPVFQTTNPISRGEVQGSN